MKDITRILLISGTALFLRIGLIVWGEVQDTYQDVKYTDVDYLVFTDGAKFIWNGVSPFERYTFRYSPLIAELLVPNIFLHHCWGKLLFSLFGQVNPLLQVLS